MSSSSPPSSPVPPHHLPVPSTSDPRDPQLFHHLETYPWAQDSAFQSGLIAILGPSTNAESRNTDLALHARCFFYTRKFGIPVDAHAYAAWREKQARGDLSSLDPNHSLALEATVPSTMDDGLGQDQELGNGTSGEISTAPQPSGHHQETQNLNQISEQHNDQAINQSHEQRHEPADFKEIMRRIQAGERITGIRDIPDTVLEGQGTKTMTPRRQKPWEQSMSASDTSSTKH